MAQLFQVQGELMLPLSVTVSIQQEFRIGPPLQYGAGTADGTAVSKYIGRGSRRNSNKLDRTTERPTIRANQCSRSAFNCESGDSLLNSSTTVHGIPSGFEYLIIDRLWAVSPYIFANCCYVVPSFHLVLGKPVWTTLPSDWLDGPCPVMPMSRSTSPQRPVAWGCVKL